MALPSPLTLHYTTIMAGDDCDDFAMLEMMRCDEWLWPRSDDEANISA